METFCFPVDEDIIGKIESEKVDNFDLPLWVYFVEFMLLLIVQ